MYRPAPSAEMQMQRLMHSMDGVRRYYSSLKARLKIGQAVMAAARVSDGPPEVNALDHQISLRNGSTSALETSRARLRTSKLQPCLSLKSRVEELTKENGMQRQEIQFYRDCFDTLQRFRHRSHDAYQQLFIASYYTQDQQLHEDLQSVTEQFEHAIRDSMSDQANAEKCWLDFWGVDYDAWKSGEIDV